jgi:hypothetical protein
VRIQPGHRGKSATLDNVALSAGAPVPNVSKPEDVYTWLLRSLLDAAHAPARDAGAATCSIASVSSQAHSTQDENEYRERALRHGLMLIGRKWERMDAAAVLESLPDITSLRDMAGCLAAMSTGMMRRRHSCTLQARPQQPAACGHAVLWFKNVSELVYCIQCSDQGTVPFSCTGNAATCARHVRKTRFLRAFVQQLVHMRCACRAAC